MSNVSGWCKATSGSKLNLKCTLVRNHKGDHIATAGGIIIEEWPKDNKTAPEERAEHQPTAKGTALETPPV